MHVKSELNLYLVVSRESVNHHYAPYSLDDAVT